MDAPSFHASPAFTDRDRFDARGKVTGQTAYTADVALPRLLYAMTVPARIAKGTVGAVPVEAALRVPGVVRVLMPRDFAPPAQPKAKQGPAAAPPPPTLKSEVSYRGEPVALVLAESLEAAIEGAEALQAAQSPQQAPFICRVTQPGAQREPAKPVVAGDGRAALARATTTLDVQYETPPQHHNPIELLATTALWAGGRLTVWECSQAAQVVKAKLAEALQLDPAAIDVRSEYIGGAFGQKGAVQRQTALVARAAMLTGRPVKLVMPRGQVFHNASFRPMTRHHIQLGADASGRMTAVVYDADHQQSRQGQFPPSYHEANVQMYGVADYLGTTANVRLDTQGPGYMRAPHPHPASFAFEGAVDELAEKLQRDPVEFRLAHNTAVDPVTGHPLSSRFLNECLVEGARRFGWSRRNPQPGATVLADGTQVGWGVACGAYPAVTTANIATLRVSADGSTRLALAGHEMGQGIRTVIAAVVLRELDIDPARLEIVIGDTRAAPQHITAGSWGTSSSAPLVEEVARQLKAQVADLLGGKVLPGNLHRQLAAVKRPFVQAQVERLAPGQKPEALKSLRDSGYAMAGPAYPQFTSFSYIAHFVEVHVEPGTRRIRVPRVVSVADCGRVVSPRTAASQVRGGVVWGIGSALREETEVDERFGGWLNNDLADYVVPVNADIGDIDVAFVDRPDPLINALGVKGLGEVAMVGASAAVANAVYHATGKRLRRMPMRIEHLL